MAFEVTSEYKVDDAKTLNSDECIRYTPNIEKFRQFWVSNFLSEIYIRRLVHTGLKPFTM